MAESVDALVSNTSGATRAGSTPALGTGFEAKVLQDLSSQHFFIHLFKYSIRTRRFLQLDGRTKVSQFLTFSLMTGRFWNCLAY